jgi:hypothetical protein
MVLSLEHPIAHDPEPEPAALEPLPRPVTPPRDAYWRVWVVPVLLVCAIRFFFRPVFTSPPWMPTIAFVLGLGTHLWLMRSHAARPAGDAARPSISTAALFAVLIAAFFARAWWHHDVFPAYLLGESGSALSTADAFANAPPQDMTHLLRSYNLGLGPLLSLVPEPMRTMEATKVLTIAVYGLVIAGFLVLLYDAQSRMQREAVGALAVFLPVAVCGLALVCTRRYKWHAIAFVAGVAVYTVLIGVQDDDERRRRSRVTGGLLLLAASVFLYHGTILFVPVLAVMLFVEARVGDPSRRAERVRLAKSLLAAALFAVAFALAKQDFSGFYQRLTFEVNDPRPEGAVSLRLLRNWNNFFDSVFITDLSFPLSVALIVGLTATLVSFRRSWLARVHLGVLAGVGVPLFYTYGFTNPDETHFALASILSLIVVGLFELTRPIVASRSRLAGLIVATVLVATEVAHYDTAQLWRRLDAFPHPNDPAYRLTLALRDAQQLRRRAPEPERLVFFLPAGIQSSEQDIKFQHLIAQRDFADVRDYVREYRWPEDVIAALRPLLQVERHAARIRVYIDDEFDVERLKSQLGVTPYAYSVIRTLPHHEVWKETIPLRFVDFVRAN